MKVSREQAQENRCRVIATASELFRERGFDGIGIAELMKAAGLTHGGFYGQFRSKMDLAAEASRQALATNAALWRDTIDRSRGKALQALARLYISGPNLVSRAKGCTFAALAADASRQGKPVQDVFAQGIEHHLHLLQEIIDGETDAEKRRRSIVLLSQMVGGLTLARAAGDAPIAEEIISALRDEMGTGH